MIARSISRRSRATASTSAERQARRENQRIEWLEHRIAPATFVVNTIADSGPGSLRQAILDANAAANAGGADVINFAILSGPFIIQPLTPLPQILEAVIIDGYSQSGSDENELAVGSDAIIQIGLDGSLTTGNGLVLGGAGGSTVRGLAIFGFGSGINDSGYGIKLVSSNNHVEGNFIGLNTLGEGSGTTANQNAGVFVGDFFGPGGPFSGNVIGGTSPADRNVLSNNAFGIALSDDALNTSVLNNYIGTTPDGFGALPNFQSGIVDSGSENLLVGNGTLAGLNVISGNNTAGIGLGRVKNPVIDFNYIGTNANGTADLANGGAGIRADNGAQGGTIRKNVISGNGGDGIELGSKVGDGNATGFNVTNNIIGANAGFNEPVSNQGAGIGFYGSSSGNTIGGIAAGLGNRIVFNVGAGISDIGGGTTNRFFGNAIFSNGGLGIDQRSANQNLFGVTPNDSPELDNITNAPELSSYFNDGSRVLLGGIFIGLPNTTYRVEFFAAAPDQLDLSGFGGAALFMGFQTLTTNAAGVAGVSFDQQVSVPLDSVFNATITPVIAGGTSEFGKSIGLSRTFTWTGTTGGDWFEPQNWSPNGVPNALDTAVLNNSGMTGITLEDTVSVKAFLQSGETLQGGGKLIVLNTWQWSGGNHDSGTLTLVEGAVGTIGTGSNTRWNEGTLENRGTINVEGMGIFFEAGTLLNATPGSAMKFAGALVDSDKDNSPVIAENFGLMYTNSAGRWGLLDIALSNHGTVEAFAGTFVAEMITGLAGDLNLAGGNLEANQFVLIGGSLTGSGIVKGNVTLAGATIHPGGIGTAGKLTIQGDLEVEFGVFDFDLNGTAPGTGYDQLVVTGTAALAGQLQFKIGGGFVVGAGDDFVLVSALSIDGEFDEVNGAPPLAQSYTANQFVLEALGFEVTNTNDSGPGSLRQAILDANEEGGFDFITFNIPGTGVHTITPQSLLPEISEGVSINGYSQPGSAQNTLARGSNAVLRIQLNGALLGASGTGLLFEADGNLVSGLIFSNWNEALVFDTSSDNLITGNWIGTDATGNAASTSQKDGLVFRQTGFNNQVGTAAPGDRNVISGNTDNGIDARDQFGLVIQNNYVGLTPSGLTALGNGSHAIFITDGVDMVVGGQDAGQGNVLSASKGTGAGLILLNTSGGLVGGNFIGTDATGNVALGNATYGIQAQNAVDLRIGGTSGFDFNVISGNSNSGIRLVSSSRVSIYGNFVGIGANGVAQLGNSIGIDVQASSDTLIGDTSPEFANHIAFNRSHGVSVGDALGSATGNSIRGNAIFSNAFLGINLVVAGETSPNFVTQNDVGDVDSGANRLINFPSLLGLERGVNTMISGTYNGAPNAGFFLDFYVSVAADSSGAGEGQFYIGTTFVTTDVNGFASFDAVVDDFTVGTFITATATNSLTLDTSEFGFILPASLIYTWDGGAGAGDTSWFNPLNWDRDANFPKVGDTAILDTNQTISLDDLDVTVATFLQSSGTLTGGAKLMVTDFLGWDGGAMRGSGQTIILGDGVGSFFGTANKLLSDRTLINQGTVSWGESGNIMLDNATFRNLGTFGIVNAAHFTTERPGKIENLGFFEKASDSGTSTVDPGIVFANSGTIVIVSGTLDVGEAFTQTQGVTQIIDATLAGSELLFTGGLLEGTGTIAASVTNSGAEVAPGFVNLPASLFITGDYVQTSGGKLTIRFAGEEFGKLSVTGDALLGGTLVADAIAVVDPFDPGDLLQILVAGDLTGTFATTNFFMPFEVIYQAEGVALKVPQGGGGGSSFTVDARNSLSFLDANGEPVRITLQGRGHITVTLVDGADDNADIASMILVETDLTTKIKVMMARKTDIGTRVLQLATSGANQHVGAITFGDKVALGDGNDDDVADLRVTGKMNALVLDDIQPHTLIRLGEDLPYNELNDKTPDSRNNRPSLNIGDILGPDVQINVLNNGIPGETLGSLGGGGFGNVLIHSWAFPGYLRTTQSLGNFTVQTGNFYGVLEVDKLEHGAMTQADVGAMTIADGSWGSSGTEIEGNVKSFSAESFLAGASIQAGSMGAMKMTEGAFEGTLILTDEQANSPALASFTVDTHFTGNVISSKSIKKLIIKGDFTGSLEAPSIGSITAFAFLGVDGVTKIEATLGALGNLKTTAGIVRDYDLITPLGFGGITVKLAKLTESKVGIQNVHVTAASIGNLSVSLTAAKGSTGVNLTGIGNSTFSTSATGTTKGKIGSIGNITVALGGGAGGNATGIFNSSFDARVGETGAVGASTVNAVGKIAVKVKGFGGSSTGLDGASFEGNTIGTTKVSVNLALGGLARDVTSANYLASGAIGALTFDGNASSTQVTGLNVTAGGKVGAVTVKATIAVAGGLHDSTILAGQALDLPAGLADKEAKTRLGNAALGAVKVSGALRNTTLAAGGSIGAISAAEMTDSEVFAGARLGLNRALGGGDDSFQRAAAIASIVVKGAFAGTSIVAGVDAGNGIYGDDDDTLAAQAGGLTTSSSIGAITLGLSSDPAAATIEHVLAIQAAAIKSLKTAGLVTKTFATAAFLDAGGDGEDDGDVLVRTVN